MAAAAGKHAAGEAADARPRKTARVAQLEDVRCWLPMLVLDEGMSALVEHLRQVGASLAHGPPMTGHRLSAPHAHFHLVAWGELDFKPVPDGDEVAVESWFAPYAIESVYSTFAEDRWLEARGGGAWVAAALAVVRKSKIAPYGDADGSSPTYFLERVTNGSGGNTFVRTVPLAATGWCDHLVERDPSAASSKRPLARALWLHGRECYEVRAALLATESWCLDTVCVVVSYL